MEGVGGGGNDGDDDGVPLWLLLRMSTCEVRQLFSRRQSSTN